MAYRLALQLALIGFLISIVRGLYSSIGFDATLHAALLSFAVMYGVGWLCGFQWSLVFETTGRRMTSAT